MKLNLEKVFKTVRKNSGKSSRYLVVIPAIGSKKCDLRDNLFMLGRRVWMPETTDILIEYRGKEFLVADDFYGYTGEKNNPSQMMEFLKDFGNYFCRTRGGLNIRVWFKELLDDAQKDIGGAGGAVAQVDGAGSGQLQRDQCGELPGADPASEEAIEEPGSTLLQPEKAAEQTA